MLTRWQMRVGLTSLAGVLMLIAGCATSPNTGAAKKAAKDLSVGDQVLIRFNVDLNGHWVATGIDVQTRSAQATPGDGDNVECEDGLTPDGQECDGGPGANADDGAEQSEAGDAAEADGDNVECEDGLTPDGQECDGGPAANADDGTEGPEAAEAEDGAEQSEGAEAEDGAEQSGGAEAEDGAEQSEGAEAEGSQAQGGFQMIALPIQPAQSQSLWAFGFRVQLPAQASLPAQGTYRFLGRYLGAGHFAASTVVPTASSTPRIAGRIQQVKRMADGRVAIQVLDRWVLAAPRLRVHKLTSLETEAAADTDGDTENDGIDCQQEGEHEGDNEGC